MIDKNKAVYISGPMTGYVDYNYPAFIAAEEKLRELGYVKIINPAKLDHPDTDWHNCIRRAIIALMGADAVVTLPGYQNSTGARTEINLARRLGMTVASFKKLISS